MHLAGLLAPVGGDLLPLQRPISMILSGYPRLSTPPKQTPRKPQEHSDGTQQLMLLVTSQSLSGKRPVGLEGSFHLPG